MTMTFYFNLFVFIPTFYGVYKAVRPTNSIITF